MITGIFCAPAKSDTTIYVVRHSEKTDDKEPVLNEVGKQRANDLANALRSIELDACYATQFIRTQQTAKPAADQAKLKVQIHKAGEEADLMVKIRTLAKADKDCHVLIAGHSNTVPKILKLCGDKNPPSLTEEDYDNLFVIHIDDQGNAHIMRLHFGEPNPVAPVQEADK